MRQSMRARLRALTTEQCAMWSKGIVDRLMRDDAWAGSGGAVALFGGFEKEPHLLPLLAWLSDRGVCAALFAIQGHGLMSPYRVRGIEDLQVGKFGVLEPKCETADNLNLSDLSVVLTPGLAFGGSDGARLGRGKGHYDRLFADQRCNARRIGVAFDVQIISAVATEAHDAAMHELVSESAWRKCGTGADKVP